MNDYYDHTNLLGYGYDPYQDIKDKDERFRDCLRRMAATGIGLLLAFVACALLCSCKTRERIVTIETVRKDTTYITMHERDSIHIHDSIHVHDKGDTVLIDRWHTCWRDRWRYDTIFIARHDTVPHPYPVIQEVEKPLTWWQQTLQRIGLAALAVMLGCIVWIVIKLYIRKV